MKRDRIMRCGFRLVAAAMVVCGVSAVGCSADAAASGQDEVAAVEMVPRANGMPLDAIEYDPPAWMPWCGRAYKVCDRTNGDEWWLLVMENQDLRGRRDVSYVVLPTGEAVVAE